MARKLTVVVSQGRSANPAKRKLEEDIVAALLFERGIEVTVVPHLYDLKPDGTGMLALQSITTDIVVLAWLFPRASRWLLDRHGVRGLEGKSLLVEESDEEEEFDEEAAEAEAETPAVEPARDVPRRSIYTIDLRVAKKARDYVEEIKRIASEKSTQTIDLMGWLGGSPDAAQTERFLHPTNDTAVGLPAGGNGNGHGSHPPQAESGDQPQGEAKITRIEEEPSRRWYPVIDFSRCTNCMECIDFCLFGVYGIDKAESILVEQPDNCRKGCPACSRVCPENAIIFPEHKAPAIAGSELANAGAFKIDLSKLFGAPENKDESLDVAVQERDRELVAAGRDAVGATVGIPKRQADKEDRQKDDLDGLIDALDDMEL